MTHITINSQSLITINPLKPKNCLPTSGKLHKIPHVTYSLEPICGSVAVIGDLTKPFSIKFKIRDKKKHSTLDILHFIDKSNSITFFSLN